MGTGKKGRVNLKKTLLVAASLFVVLLVLLIVTIPLVIKSPSFVDFVENLVSGRIERHVEIGSIRLKKGPAIVISDMVVMDGAEGTPPQAVVPGTEIGFTLSSLLKRKIESIALIKPKLFIDVEKTPAPAAPEAPEAVTPARSIPAFFKRLSIEEGEVTLRLEEGVSYTAGPINLSVEASPEKKASVSGDFFIKEFGAAVSFETSVEMEGLDMEGGRVDIGPVELEKAGLKGFPLLEGMELKGSAQLKLELSKQEEGGLAAELKGTFEDLGLGGGERGSSAELRALFDVSGDYGAVGVEAEAILETPHQGSEGAHRAFFKANYEAKGRELVVEKATLSSRGLGRMDVRGSFRNFPSSDPFLSINVKAEEISLSGLKALLLEPLGISPKGLEYSGALRGTASAEGSVADGIRWSSEVSAGNFLVSSGGLKADFDGKPLNLASRGSYSTKNGLVVRDMAIRAQAMNLAPGTEGLSSSLTGIEITLPYASYRDPAVRTGVFGIKAEKAVIKISNDRSYEEEKISVRGRLEGDLERPFIRLKGLSLDSATLRGGSAEVSLDLGEPVIIDSSLDLKGMELEGLWPRLPHIFPAAEELDVKGTMSMKTAIRATFPDGGPARVKGRAELGVEGGFFSTPPSDIIGDGVALKVGTDFDLTFPGTEARFDLVAEASGFELLAGSFYGDFGGSPVALSLEGEYAQDSDSFKVSRAALGLGDMGTLNMAGEIRSLSSSPSFDVEMVLKELSNQKAYDFFVRETFKEGVPLLSGLEVDGTTALSISVKGSTDDFDAVGELRVADTNIHSREEGQNEDKGSGLSLEGIDISLPIFISYPGAAAPKAVERYGSIVIKGISYGPLELKGLEASASLWQNSLVFRDEIALPLFGGTVRLKDLRYRDLISPGRRLLLAIEIDGVDLSEASVALGLPRFSGDFSGTIPEVSFSGSTLSTEGEMSLKLFGGEMLVRGIAVNNVFSPAASLSSSVQFKDIDLGRLTETFEFGRITGVIEGYVEDLVIVDGQPESFVARIETVKRRGVSQRISTEALDKISILGTGSTASVLNRGIYRLFSEYRYRKMGFRGRLRNDRFLLHGIEKEDDKEYIVRGGVLPPKVDVINYTNVISFKEMVRRLERIRLVGSTEGVRVE